MPDRFDRRLEARKRAYEQRKQIRTAMLEARKARHGLGIVVSSIKRRPRLPALPTARPYRGAAVETVKPELIPPKEPLVDVFDEGTHLRVDVQLQDLPWPEDTIGELEGISFKHGVLELKLRKREPEGLSEEEKGALTSAEVEKVTAKVKEKLMLKLKKRRLG